MEIQWRNIMAAVMLVAGIILTWRYYPMFAEMFSELSRHHRHHYSDPLPGLILFGMTGILIIAALKIIFSNRS